MTQKTWENDLFNDRQDAALHLAKRLQSYQGTNPLILAIPRGAVPMGKIIAQQLDGDFDVVLVRKLCAPHQPELAVGAVNEDGETYLADLAELYGANAAHLKTEIQIQLATIRKRRAQYANIKPSASPSGRIVIVVDDGLATGATMISALKGLRLRKPAKLICAVPVAPPDTLLKIKAFADEVVCIETPHFFKLLASFTVIFLKLRMMKCSVYYRIPNFLDSPAAGRCRLGSPCGVCYSHGVRRGVFQ